MRLPRGALKSPQEPDEVLPSQPWEGIAFLKKCRDFYFLLLPQDRCQHRQNLSLRYTEREVAFLLFLCLKQLPLWQELQNSFSFPLLWGLELLCFMCAMLVWLAATAYMLQGLCLAILAPNTPRNLFSFSDKASYTRTGKGFLGILNSKAPCVLGGRRILRLPHVVVRSNPATARKFTQPSLMFLGLSGGHSSCLLRGYGAAYCTSDFSVNSSRSSAEAAYPQKSGQNKKSHFPKILFDDRSRENPLSSFGAFSVSPKKLRAEPDLQQLAALCRSFAIATPVRFLFSFCGFFF